MLSTWEHTNTKAKDRICDMVIIANDHNRCVRSVRRITGRGPYKISEDPGSGGEQRQERHCNACVGAGTNHWIYTSTSIEFHAKSNTSSHAATVCNDDESTASTAYELSREES